jgi:hypothetical protein
MFCDFPRAVSQQGRGKKLISRQATYINIYIVTHFQTVFSLLFMAYSSSGTITYLIPPKRRSFFAWLRTEMERFFDKNIAFQSKQI